ncbi:hypothetical protein BH23VER1_BH23VER1_32570 [soil metagenome]
MSVCNSNSRLPALWKEAADDLGFEVVSPFELILKSGACVRFPLLVRHFGAIEGMLILSDYSLVSGWIDEIQEAGYGFSVWSEPDLGALYDRAGFIEVFLEWGWAGPESETPAWLRRS